MPRRGWGGKGPALIPESLGRLKGDKLAAVVSDGRAMAQVPGFRDTLIGIIDMEDWSLVRVIETSGPGFFLRSPDGTPCLWADVFTGELRGAMHIIDKPALEVVQVLKPEPGKTVAHTEFTRGGPKALVSIWEMDGAVIVYDAATFTELGRLPMVRPSGKYTVWTKITCEDGTSHHARVAAGAWALALCHRDRGDQCVPAGPDRHCHRPARHRALDRAVAVGSAWPARDLACPRPGLPRAG